MPDPMPILVWGRGTRLDNPYSRDRVVFRLLQRSGVQLCAFSPLLSALGDVEAAARNVPRPAAVWVPSFRLRDVAAAARFARRRHCPLIFDPLISAYDKQVNERGKLAAGSRAAGRLLARERALFAKADILVADTAGHARYFAEQLGVPASRILILPVGADESLFRPQEPAQPPAARLQVLFYGSFIGLHGVAHIVDAIQRYAGPPADFVLIGDGPERPLAEQAFGQRAELPGGHTVRLSPPLPIDELPRAIAAADIVLGIFGTSGKADRVIPNKVYQALACARPVITGDTSAFPAGLRQLAAGAIGFVPPGDGAALARHLADWAHDRTLLRQRGQAARRLFEARFSEQVLQARLMHDLAQLGLRLPRAVAPGPSPEPPCPPTDSPFLTG